MRNTNTEYRRKREEGREGRVPPKENKRQMINETMENKRGREMKKTVSITERRCEGSVSARGVPREHKVGGPKRN